MIPDSYAQWRECIEVHCKIPLTTAFVDERLAELQNESDPRTATFVRLYGAQHLERTIGWFRRAGEELAS